MRREIGVWRILTNIGFVVIVLGIAGFGIYGIATRQWRVQQTFVVRADFETIGGVDAGGRVRVLGIDAGVIEAVVPPKDPGKPVRLILRVDEKLRSLVRSDALARIVTEGVVGAKLVEIVPGKPDAAPLGQAGLIASEKPIELADLLKTASASLKRLDTVTDAAEKGLGEINAIAATIRKGEGSLGKFVQEDEAYRKVVGLSDRGERTLHDLEENLQALKRTWPISRYFNERAFFERDRILYQPGSARDIRTLREDELFMPGRAVLTAQGKQKLDEVGNWFKKVKRPTTEVVIAVFNDDNTDPAFVQQLTQEQADAVRKHLVAKHSIDSTGWFGTRKVAAVGFGNNVPHTPGEEEHPQQPARRVEIILFTPQA